MRHCRHSGGKRFISRAPASQRVVLQNEVRDASGRNPIGVGEIFDLPVQVLVRSLQIHETSAKIVKIRRQGNQLLAHGFHRL